MPAQFEFVSASGFGKPEPGDRRLIRSRCMQGKNKRTGSRRSIQEARKDAKLAAQKSQTLQPNETLRPPPSDLALVQLPGELGDDKILSKCK